MQIYQVCGCGDIHPMANTAPTDEINRRVSVLLKIQEGNRPADSTTNQVSATTGTQ
jgi:hypothetical protein